MAAIDDHCATLPQYSEEQVDCYKVQFCGDDCDYEDPCADLEEGEKGACYDAELHDARDTSDDPCEALEGEEADACHEALWEDPCADLSDEDAVLSCYESLLSEMEPCSSDDDLCDAEFEEHSPCSWSDDECWEEYYEELVGEDYGVDCDFEDDACWAELYGLDYDCAADDEVCSEAFWTEFYET